MSIIKHVTLQKIVAHDFRYDPRSTTTTTTTTATTTTTTTPDTTTPLTCNLGTGVQIQDIQRQSPPYTLVTVRKI